MYILYRYIYIIRVHVDIFKNEITFTCNFHYFNKSEIFKRYEIHRRQTTKSQLIYQFSNTLVSIINY